MEVTQNHGSTSIVILGAWNPSVFNPKWMSGGRLTSAAEIKFEIAFNNPEMPLRYRFDDICLDVSRSRLLLTPSKEGDELLNRIEETTIKICTCLEHTPITALGVNFKYHVKDPSGELLNVFNVKGNGVLVDDGDYTINETSIKRSLVADGHLINLTLTYNNQGTVVVDFNFHQDIFQSSEIESKIKDKMIGYRDQSKSILSSITNS